MITYAPTIHALCGLTYLSNPPDRLDVGPGFSLNDHAAGLSAAVAVLAALEARRRTGEGQHVDIAQMETGTYLIGPAVLDYLANGREAHPVGNADPFGPVVPERGVPLRRPARGGDHVSQRRRLGAALRDRVLGHRRSRRRSRAGHGGRRFARRAEIDAPPAPWCATRTADAAAEALQANGVPAGKVQDAGDLMADPQLVARDFWRHRPRRVRRAALRPLPRALERTDLEPYVPSGVHRRAQLRRLRRARRPRARKTSPSVSATASTARSAWPWPSPR